MVEKQRMAVFDTLVQREVDGGMNGNGQTPVMEVVINRVVSFIIGIETLYPGLEIEPFRIPLSDVTAEIRDRVFRLKWVNTGKPDEGFVMFRHHFSDCPVERFHIAIGIFSLKYSSRHSTLLHIGEKLFKRLLCQHVPIQIADRHSRTLSLLIIPRITWQSQITVIFQTIRLIIYLEKYVVKQKVIIWVNIYSSTTVLFFRY
jgi:hypothetical protein